MLNGDAFAQMKDGAVLLNFSRDALVDEAALLSALNGRLRRYMTDFPTDALLGHEKVIAIPHLGASTPESEENCAAMAAKELRDYLVDGTVVNSVNLPACCMSRSGATRVAVIHLNVTNMVGQITSRLASRGHNIANMVNHSRGEMAYTLLDLDEEPNGDGGRGLIDALNAIEGVLRVRVL
jgi:D-3-phosphoglycerate dehydrogenase